MFSFNWILRRRRETKRNKFYCFTFSKSLENNNSSFHTMTSTKVIFKNFYVSKMEIVNNPGRELVLLNKKNIEGKGFYQNF